MSEVNADGTLLNPREAILQEVQALTNSLTAEEPEGMEDDKARPVQAGNGQPAGEAGGGANPGEALPAWAVALSPAEVLDDFFRRRPVPILGRIHRGKLLLDVRTLLPGDGGEIAAALRAWRGDTL